MPVEIKTLEGHAADLRKYAEMTARHSQNWDNFEGICLQMLKGAFEAGKDSVVENEFGPDIPDLD